MERDVCAFGPAQRASVPPSGASAWRVFVVLRDAPGVYERRVRASGPIEAETVTSIADPRVLETLGAQLDGQQRLDDADQPGYRPLEATGRRFLWLRPLGAPTGAWPPAPFAELMARRG